MKTTDTIASILQHKTHKNVHSIAPGQTVFEALVIMAEHDIGALLVLDEGRLIGILSERDYARRGSLMGRSARKTSVREIMTAPVLSVSPQNTAEDCMNMMTRRHFRHLPVIDHGAIVGVVSIGDLVKWVITGQRQQIQEMEGYIKDSYPG
jgi:CBS domain-containing protein